MGIAICVMKCTKNRCLEDLPYFMASFIAKASILIPTRALTTADHVGCLSDFNHVMNRSVLLAFRSLLVSCLYLTASRSSSWTFRCIPR